MKEMFAKKKKIGDVEKEAKMGVMKEISDMAGAAMGDKLKGLKKVSVMSDSKEGLDAGLSKAKDMLDKNIAESEESPEDKMEEDAEQEIKMPEGHEECPGCIECADAKIAMLQKLKSE